MHVYRTVLFPKRVIFAAMNEMLRARSGGKCELCGKDTEVVVYNEPPHANRNNEVVISQSLLARIEGQAPVNPGAWRFLTEDMWSEVPAVQVVPWRRLNPRKGECWATYALDILYLGE